MKKKQANIDMNKIREELYGLQVEPKNIPNDYFIINDSKMVPRKIIIGTIITELRTFSGFTQKQIASLLGIGQNTYSKYENGIIMPNIETLIRLANLYDISLDIITGRRIEDLKGGLLLTKMQKGEQEHKEKQYQSLMKYTQEENRILCARIDIAIQANMEDIPQKENS